MPQVQRGNRGVTGAVAHVESPIVRSIVLIRPMGIRGPKICQRRDRKTDAVRPRVISIEVDSFAKPPSGIQQETVVALRAAVVELFH